MWIFDSPKNYSEMVEKIAKSAFAISLFLLYFLTSVNSEFNLFMKQLSFDVEYEFVGIKLNLALLYLPLLVGIAEHAFKIHDKISNFLGIRSRYDKNVVATEILKNCALKINVNTLKPSEIKTVLSIAFYKYVSSTKPIIDQHYIQLTLNTWCWYWITLDTLSLFTATSVLFLILKWSYLNLLLVVIIILILYIILKLIRNQAKEYTEKELKTIFSDEIRVYEIQKELSHALPYK